MQKPHGTSPTNQEALDQGNQGRMNGNSSELASVQTDQSSYFFSKLPPPGTTAMIVAGHDQGCLPRNVFAPLPPKIATQSMVFNSLQSMCKAWPLFKEQSVRDMIDEQFNVGPEDCHANPARWATINTLLAMATQWKAANPLAKDVFPISWTYLKNAYSVVPELNLQATSIQACEALLIMVLVMRLTADARSSAILLSVVTTMANVLGLGCKDSCLAADSRDMDQHNRMFWMIRILNTQAAMRHGLPPILSEGKTEVELPNHERDQSVANKPVNTNILRHMAELSIIQNRAYTLLRPARSLQRESAELAKNLSKLDTSLCTWNARLPAELQCPLDCEQTVADLDPGAMLLHFEFYATRWAMYSGNAPVQPFAWLWYMLCYPVCAFLILLKEVLNDPHGDEVASNLAHMTTFTHGLEDWRRREGYEIHKVIECCSKLLAIASFAATCPRSDAPFPEPMDMNTAVSELSGQCKTLRDRFHQTVDFMHLTQGLMSNMPAPYALAIRTFSGILEFSPNPANAFGPFVPDILKPCTYRFFYGPN
ncbi:fungal-specific transcription factor domain-containing protein [Apiospora rasikravindrae]|uniref:Fungal-specific transcription factor domain-containing protein n=1 Tax=Apiospora rasikravindrae TaxID=990691 RepID=A0ABR1SX85_9PEZI